MRRTVTLAAALLVAAPALAHGPFDGFWAPDPEWCGNQRGTTDQVPLMIDLPVMLGYESECVFEGFERIGEGNAWRAGLVCTGEGMTWEREAIYAFRADEDGTPETLVEIDLEDGELRILSRCP